jgi:uncharacterized protein
MTPREDRIYELFEQAARNVLTGAEILVRLVAAPIENRPELARMLVDVEHAGDHATHEIMRTVNTSSITPFDRDDLTVLAGRLDDVIDDIEQAAELTVLYRIGDVPDGVHKQAALLADAAALTVEAMPRLRTLRDLESYWIGINELENSADTVYRVLVADLLNNDGDLRTMIKIKEVVDQLEAAADAFERVANVVQSIAAKSPDAVS